MKLNKLQLFSLSGILGSLLMFTGDMLLYYEPVSGLEYDSVTVMSTMPIKRLIAGGLIGPVASVFSLIGGYLFYIVFRSTNKVLAKILFACFAVFFIVAGTYHAMFPNFGFIGRLPESLQPQQLLFIRTYLKSIYTLIFICATFWTIILFYLVIFKKSLYPVWMLLFTPTLLLLLSQYVKDYIPYPLGAIIYGGWINLCFMVFFLVCFLHFSRRKIKSAISGHEL
ncbi:MAG: hypothetical protein K8R68_08595 [Bacteroidales bacterium]|nr:hypothetical protein [Bacteroidales bacterium]